MRPSETTGRRTTDRGGWRVTVGGLSVEGEWMIDGRIDGCADRWMGGKVAVVQGKDV